MTKHIEWETLNDFVDESPALDAGARRGAAAHLADCTECREVVGRLRGLVAAAAEISEVVPPAEVWTSISAAVERRKSVHLASRVTTTVIPAPTFAGAGSAGSQRPSSAAPRSLARFWIGVTAVTVAAASLLFVIANRSKAGDDRDAAAGVNIASLPDEVLRIEREYGATADALSAAMKEPRVSANAPGVVESVARSVAVIDTAIAEARDALIKDPSSDFVRLALVRNYEQKIDLLRRVTARASSN